jgi:hypothetical protein
MTQLKLMVILILIVNLVDSNENNNNKNSKNVKREKNGALSKKQQHNYRHDDDDGYIQVSPYSNTRSLNNNQFFNDACQLKIECNSN